MAAMAAARALTVNQYLERRNRYDGLCSNMEVTPTYDRAPASRAKKQQTSAKSSRR